MVEQLKRAKDWDQFVKSAEEEGLKKLLTVVSQSAKGCPSLSSSQPIQSKGTREGSNRMGSKNGEHWGDSFKNHSQGPVEVLFHPSIIPPSPKGRNTSPDL